MTHEHARAHVLDDVEHLLGLAVPVDRHGVGAERGRGLLRLEEGEVVAQQQRHRVALAHAERIEAARGLQGAAGQQVALHGASVEDHLAHVVVSPVGANGGSVHQG